MKKKLGFDLIILGTPASGKDTQAVLLARKFALRAVESGKYLRGLSKNRTRLGLLVRNRLAKGQPAPSLVIKEFLAANLRLAGEDKNLIFVGNPRLKPEAEFLVKLLKVKNRDFYALYIDLPSEEIWKRSAHRMRDDQDLHYVRERISWHKGEVSKTVKFFQKIGKLQKINGSQTIKQVNRDIVKAINDYRKSRTS